MENAVDLGEKHMKRVQIAACILLLCLLCGCQKETVAPSWAAAENKASAPSADADGWQEKYDLGVRYLNDGNYEEAVIAFTSAIEIDPKNPDGYLRLADAYMGQGDTEAALRTLRQGADVTGDDMLLASAEEKEKELAERAERDRMTEQLSAGFPAWVSPACVEFVSYSDDVGSYPYPYDPSFSRYVDDPAHTSLRYRSVSVDGPNGPECYALYGEYADYEERIWRWKLYYGFYDSDGTPVTGALELPTMDIYNAQSEVVLYWDESRGIWCLEVCNIITNHYSTAEGADVTAYALSGIPYVIETWQKDSDYFYTTGLGALQDEMKQANLPHIRQGGAGYMPAGDDLDIILCGTSAQQAIWLYRCEHFILGNPYNSQNSSAVTIHLRREWREQELMAYEQWVQAHAADAIERDAALERYRLEFRPELSRNEADYCYGEDTGQYLGYAIVDTETGWTAATFSLSFADEDEKSWYYNEDWIGAEWLYRGFVDGCIVYFLEALTPFDSTLSFDTRTKTLYELPDEYRYAFAGQYLIGSTGVSNNDCLILMTPRGKVCEILNDAPDKWNGFFARRNMIYYYSVPQNSKSDVGYECELWRYELESGKKTRLGTIPSISTACYYIGDDFADYEGYQDGEYGVFRMYY